MLESRIEKVLCISPELIDMRFRDRAVVTQATRGRARLDLLVCMPRGVIVVEIKKVVLSVKDVKQVLAYCRLWAMHHPQRVLHETYLVGYPPADEKALYEAAATSVFRLRLRYLGKHIPKIVQEKPDGGYEAWRESSRCKTLRIAD